jgi:hypothetical protein
MRFATRNHRERIIAIIPTAFNVDLILRCERSEPRRMQLKRRGLALRGSALRAERLRVRR